MNNRIKVLSLASLVSILSSCGNVEVPYATSNTNKIYLDSTYQKDESCDFEMKNYEFADFDIYGLEVIEFVDSNKDDYYLAKIAMAEAEGEGVDGKALVMNVVMNRVVSEEFPNTVQEVVFQNRNGIYQFAPIQTGGRWWTTEPDEECYEALEKVKDGYDISQGATYFEAFTTKSTWHSRNLKTLFRYGNHTFYK